MALYRKLLKQTQKLDKNFEKSKASNKQKKGQKIHPNSSKVLQKHFMRKSKNILQKKANRQVKDKKSSEKDRFVIINSISEYTLLLVQLQLYKSSKIIEATGLSF